MSNVEHKQLTRNVTAAHSLTFTLVASQYDHVGTPNELSWPDWSAWLTTHEIVDQPKDLRIGFVPGTAPCKGSECRHKHDARVDLSQITAYTSDVHVSHLHALVLDFEAADDELGRKRGVPDDALDRIVDSFAGAALAMYTSPSKPDVDDEHRFRVVAPLSRRVKRNEWKPFWLAAAHAYGAGFADPTCKNVSRYYVAPTRYAHETHWWAHEQEGPTIDVDSVLERYVREVPAPTRKAASQVVDISLGTSRDFLGAIEALPQLTDGRWNAVRTLAFSLGKWAAYRSLDLDATLLLCAERFERALEQCDLSERNPLDKLMRTAETCAENGWKRRSGELEPERAADRAKLDSIIAAVAATRDRKAVV